MPRQVLLELRHSSLGAKEDFLRQRRCRDAAGRITEVFAQQIRFGHQRFAHHVAGREAVHGVGHRNQRQRRGAIGDGGQIGRFLRIAAKQDGVAGREQGVNIVVPGHHVERVFGNDPCGYLQHEAAEFFADGDIVRLQRIENALT